MSSLSRGEALQAASIIFPDMRITARNFGPEQHQYVEGLVVQIGWASQNISWAEFIWTAIAGQPGAGGIKFLSACLVKAAKKYTQDQMRANQSLARLGRGEVSGAAVVVVRNNQKHNAYQVLDETGQQVQTDITRPPRR